MDMYDYKKLFGLDPQEQEEQLLSSDVYLPCFCGEWVLIYDNEESTECQFCGRILRRGE